MGCERVVFRDKDGKVVGSGIVCSRGRAKRKECCVAGCFDWGEYLCDYPLKGHKEGQTCDRPLCRKHAKLIKNTAEGAIHYCPGHVRAEKL